MSFKDTEHKVIRWAMEREMFSEEHGTTAARQVDKLQEELDELRLAVENNDLREILDALGDMMVVMTMIAYLKHMDLEFAYEYAYNQIKDRKGKMVNGLFVKEI